MPPFPALLPEFAMNNRRALATLLATLPFASPAFAADPFARQDTETSSVSRVVDNGLDLTVKTVRKTRTRDDGSVETTENVEVHATLDGQPVPEERIRRDGNRVEVLDERGTVIQRVVVASGGANRASRNAPPMVEPPARPMLGVTLEEPGEPLVKQLRLAPGRTTLLTSIVPESPAAKAGLETYDLVVGIGGRDDASPEAIRDFLAGAKVGDAVSLAIVREGERREVTVTLEAMGDAMAARLDPAAALDPSIRELVERLRARGIELDLDAVGGTGTVVAPGGPGVGSMRLFVPRPGVPMAPAAPDLREFEERMQEMRREMERTRRELERLRAAPSAPVPIPAPAAPVGGRDA